MYIEKIKDLLDIGYLNYIDGIVSLRDDGVFTAFGYSPYIDTESDLNEIHTQQTDEIEKSKLINDRHSLAVLIFIDNIGESINMVTEQAIKYWSDNKYHIVDDSLSGVDMPTGNGIYSITGLNVPSSVMVVLSQLNAMADDWYVDANDQFKLFSDENAS